MIRLPSFDAVTFYHVFWKMQAEIQGRRSSPSSFRNGTRGGNSTSSNVTWEHLLSYTWVSYPIPGTQPSDNELLGNIMSGD
jgi:hypothetical protein